MSRSGTSINDERKGRSQANSGVSDTELLLKKQQQASGDRKRKANESPRAIEDGIKPPTPKRGKSKGSVDRWPEEVITKLQQWLGRRINRLRRHDRKGAGQVISWVYIPEAEVNYFVANNLHKAMKYRTFTDQVSSYIKSGAMMTRIPLSSSKEKKLSEEQKMEVIKSLENDWPRCYLEESFQVDVTMTNNLFRSEKITETSNHGSCLKQANTTTGKDNSSQCVDTQHSHTITTNISEEHIISDNITSGDIVTASTISNPFIHKQIVDNDMILVSEPVIATTGPALMTKMSSGSAHFALGQNLHSELGQSLQDTNNLVNIVDNEYTVIHESTSFDIDADVNVETIDQDIDNNVSDDVINKDIDVDKVGLGSVMTSLLDSTQFTLMPNLHSKPGPILETDQSLGLAHFTSDQKFIAVSHRGEKCINGVNSSNISQVSGENNEGEKIPSLDMTECMTLTDLPSNMIFHETNQSTINNDMANINSQNQTSDSLSDIDHPDHLSYQINSNPRQRPKDKSKKHPLESSLTSDQKTQLRKLEERKRLALEPPDATRIPRKTNPKSQVFDQNTSVRQRLEYYLGLKLLPRCKRWEVNKWIPVQEIDLVGREFLTPIISKLNANELTQQEYASIQKQWVKIANAMMLTAGSYDRSKMDEDGFICGRPLITTSRKKKERLLKKLTSAWSSRKYKEVDPDNKSQGKGLSKSRVKALRHARVLAQSKHINKIPQYISKVRDEVQHLKNKEERYKTLELERKARFLFEKKPSLKTVHSVFNGVKKMTVLEKDCIKFYRELYSKKQELATPEVDRWCKKWENRAIVAGLEDVQGILQERIKYSSPFKSPGPNNVYPAAFKRFTSLQDVLYAKVMTILSGKVKTLKDEHIANAFLLPKTDDSVKLRSPTNYRVINCINSDIKYLNAVVYGLIYRNCYKYLQMNQSAAFRGMTGTLNAYVINVTILRQHKKAVSCMYTDMQKAFDSVDQTSMNKIVQALNIPQSVKDYIQQIMTNA